MKALIERLVAAGNAYVAEEHVLFSVPSMPEYGQLARRSPDEMMAGARVEVAPYKRDAMDFVLWKPPSARPGERRRRDRDESRAGERRRRDRDENKSRGAPQA